MSEHPFTLFHSEAIRQNARRSAEEIVPLLIEWLSPQSVADVGCGAGTWLKVFHEHGISDTVGIDGEWVDEASLEIPKQQFVTGDLQEPIHLGRRFDLVLSLEVAHYLPARSSSRFIRSLTELGDAVLFSSAIPGQWGNDHVNEQWPEYWAREFEQCGFVTLDWLRTEVWHNKNVDWWYAQNALLFARPQILEVRRQSRRDDTVTRLAPLSVVHPRHFEQHLWMYRILQASSIVVDFIPAGQTIILIDGGQFGDNFATQRQIERPFELEKQHYGPPRDAEAAIAETNRLERSGARYLVVGWPCFWWFEHYVEFEAYVDRTFACVHRDDNVIVFISRNPGEALTAG